MDLRSQQALEDLRDLAILAEKAVESGLGGPLTMKALHELRSALGRAFEIGAAYGRAGIATTLPSAPTTPPPPNYETLYGDDEKTPVPFIARGRRKT